MSPGLAALAVAVVAGGIIAVSSRESRVAILGLTLAGVIAPIIGDPLPDPLALAVRVVATLLAGYLLWAALREAPVTSGSELGWPAEALLAGAAGVAGWGAIQVVTGVVVDGQPALIAELGPREALAAGTALGVLALGPVLIGRDALRLGIGLVLGVQAAGLVRAGLAGSAPPLEHLVVAGLTLAIAAGTAMLIVEALRAGHGLELNARIPGAPGRRSATRLGTWRTPDGGRWDDDAGGGPEPDGPDHVAPRSGIGRRSVPGR